MISNIGNYEWISSVPQLEQAVKTLEGVKEIGIDTEFLRDKHYWPRLCLIQISTGADLYLIDAIALKEDISLLKPVLTSEAHLKIFHSARQDLEIFHQHFAEVPAPIFDLQLAALACNLGESVGFDKLAKALLGIDIDKSAQLTDWSRRPLSKKQLTYAIEDTKFLLAAYRKIKDILGHRVDWLKEAHHKLLQTSKESNDPELAWKRFKHLRKVGPNGKEFLKVLAKWRELLAQRKNVLRREIMSDQEIINACINYENNKFEKLDHLNKKGYPPLKQLLEELNDAPAPLYEERIFHLTSAERQTLKNMRSVVLQEAEHQGISPCLIATKQELIAFLKEPLHSAISQGWRKELVYKKLSELVKVSKES